MPGGARCAPAMWLVQQRGWPWQQPRYACQTCLADIALHPPCIPARHAAAAAPPEQPSATARGMEPDATPRDASGQRGQQIGGGGSSTEEGAGGSGVGAQRSCAAAGGQRWAAGARAVAAADPRRIRGVIARLPPAGGGQPPAALMLTVLCCLTTRLCSGRFNCVVPSASLHLLPGCSAVERTQLLHGLSHVPSVSNTQRNLAAASHGRLGAPPCSHRHRCQASNYYT